MRTYQPLFVLLLTAVTFSAFTFPMQSRKEKRIATVYLFLRNLKSKKTHEVRNMLGFPLTDLHLDEQTLEADITRAAALLKEYGIPAPVRLTLQKDTTGPRKYTYISAPLPVTPDADKRLLKATIRIGFLDELDDSKVARYEILTDYRMSVIEP
ncbi:hypothetical protein F0L74_07615 [Chitinophaga agrisoli]|uniref:Uncharacterized protein n=1 Tax=Chitinophaga agrisoli TaxID=2607653 RepID=A0A5B2VTN5_9BACT|nr:hypothetical protein [Chitinophaga agrisoli]KAA2242405.1 hypothetical protein F0L74_07615 [Chitinophaga agrisoli]